MHDLYIAEVYRPRAIFPLIMFPPVGNEAISVAFVRPSVSLSVRRVHSEYFENPKA